MNPQASVKLYCDIHSACYQWAAALKAYTATKVTTLAINSYLVAIGFRPGFSVILDASCNWEHVAAVFSPLNLTLVATDKPTKVYILGPGITPPVTRLHGGFLFPEVERRQRSYDIFWRCRLGDGHLMIWHEPAGELGRAERDTIERRRKELEKALSPLGFTGIDAHIVHPSR